MNPPTRLITPERRPDDRSYSAGEGHSLFSSRRFFCMLLTYFVGIAAVCLISTLGFSASGCLWNPHLACFSFSRHGLPLIIGAAQMWGFLAFLVAILGAVTSRVQFRRKWWHDVILVTTAIIISQVVAYLWGAKTVMWGSKTLVFAASHLHEPSVLIVELLVLHIAFLLCRPAVAHICKAVT